MLLVQTNRCLRAIFLLVKEAKKLPVIFPIPAGIVDVRESFILDLVRDIVEGRERRRRRAGFSAGALFLRQTQCADAGENFEPGQKQPAERADQSQAARLPVMK